MALDWFTLVAQVVNFLVLVLLLRHLLHIGLILLLPKLCQLVGPWRLIVLIAVVGVSQITSSSLPKVQNNLISAVPRVYDVSVDYGYYMGCHGEQVCAMSIFP